MEASQHHLARWSPLRQKRPLVRREKRRPEERGGFRRPPLAELRYAVCRAHLCHNMTVRSTRTLPNHTETAVLRRPTQIKALGRAQTSGCSRALYRREIPCGCVLRAKLKDEFLVVVALVLQRMGRTLSTARRPSTANMTSRKRPTLHDRDVSRPRSSHLHSHPPRDPHCHHPCVRSARPRRVASFEPQRPAVRVDMWHHNALLTGRNASWASETGGLTGRPCEAPRWHRLQNTVGTELVAVRRSDVPLLITTLCSSDVPLLITTLCSSDVPLVITTLCSSDVPLVITTLCSSWKSSAECADSETVTSSSSTKSRTIAEGTCANQARWDTATHSSQHLSMRAPLWLRVGVRGFIALRIVSTSHNRRAMRCNGAKAEAAP